MEGRARRFRAGLGPPNGDAARLAREVACRSRASSGGDFTAEVDRRRSNRVAGRRAGGSALGSRVLRRGRADAGSQPDTTAGQIEGSEVPHRLATPDWLSTIASGGERGLRRAGAVGSLRHLSTTTGHVRFSIKARSFSLSIEHDRSINAVCPDAVKSRPQRLAATSLRGLSTWHRSRALKASPSGASPAPFP